MFYNVTVLYQNMRLMPLTRSNMKVEIDKSCKLYTFRICNLLNNGSEGVLHSLNVMARTAIFCEYNILLRLVL